MRLLILSQYFWPENFRINELAVELARRGHDVCVLTGLPNYPDGKVFAGFRKSPHEWNKLGDVDIVRVPLVPRGRHSISLVANYLSFAMSAAMLGAWKLRGRPFDAVLVYQLSPATIGLPSVILRWLKRAPTVFWVQDLWPDTLAAMGVVRSQKVLRWVDLFLSWVYRHTDHVLGQSQAFLPRLRQQVPADVPVSYLPNWAPAGDGAVDAGREAGKNVFQVYYLGNIGEAQDFPTVIDAISSLAHRDDLHWNFVGDGRLADWLKQQLEQRHLTHRVSMLGRHPLEAMPRFYRAADALLVSLKAQPLFSLTVPSKVQAYLAAGVPLLGMLDGEGARIIRDAGAGIACPAGNSAKLAEAVSNLMAMPRDRRLQMGAAGRAYSEAEFDFTRIVDRLEQILEEAGRKSVQPVEVS